MKDLTCVVVGGGHAGIYAAQAISQESQKHGRRIQVTLIDKQPYHVRKVLLFKPAVEAEDITVPWGRILPDGIRFVQGMVRSVESGEKFLLYVDEAGDECRMDYDMLVVAAGSVVRQPHRDQGGIALTDKEAAVRIRKRWNKNLRIAARETDAQERERLLTVAVVGRASAGSRPQQSLLARCGSKQKRWE
nr:FAD-dependent oxidoreductase [Brevibacillus ruminantium]